jgi:hypothetical protein
MELTGDSKISPIGLGSGQELHGKEEEATVSPLWGLAQPENNPCGSAMAGGEVGLAGVVGFGPSDHYTKWDIHGKSVHPRFVR